MKKKKIIFLSLIIILLVSGLYIYKEYNRKNTDLGSVQANIKLSAGELLQKFEADEAAANKIFLTRKDYIVAVDGQVKDVIKDEKGYYTISLGDTTTMSTVRCSVDTMYNQRAASVRQGDKLSIQGAVTGFNKDELLGSDVILNRCAIIATKK